MKSLWMYVCNNPECATSHVPGSTKQLAKPPRCYSCGEPRHELRLYAPGRKAAT